MFTTKSVRVTTPLTLTLTLSCALHAETRQTPSSLKAKKTQHYLGGTVVDGNASDIRKSHCAEEEFLPVLSLETKKGGPSETVLHFKMPGSSETIRMTVPTEDIKTLKIKKGTRLCAMDDEENRD